MRNLDPRQNGALRQGIVLGFVAGAHFGRYSKEWDPSTGEGYPKDTAVVDRVLRDAQAAYDLFPNLSRIAEKDEEQRRSEGGGLDG